MPVRHGLGITLFLYKSLLILQAETVRIALFTCALLAFATAGYAQEQERKLVDRLLSPDTKLSNPDQNKKFNGGTEAPTRSASTKTFYVSEKKLTKSFLADRQAPTSTFSTRSYTTKSAAVPTSPPMKGFETKKARDVSTNGYSAKKYATGDFA